MRNRSGGLNGAPQITWVNIIATLGLIATLGGGAWLLFQNQFSNIQSEMRSADNALLQDIKDNQTELNRLRENTLSRNEHVEYVKRVDSELKEIKDRLALIESTRPTTGELQSIGSGTRDSINEIKDRVRSLEDNLRRPQQPFFPQYTPIPPQYTPIPPQYTPPHSGG